MAVCSLFNRMLLLTDLIPMHLVYCGQTVMIGCNHTSFEWTRAVRHIYGIIRHMQGLYRVWRESWFKYGLILRIIPLYLETILEMWEVWDFHERLLSIKMPRNLVTSTLSKFLLSISILKFRSGLLLCLFLNIMKLVLSVFRDNLLNLNQFDIFFNSFNSNIVTM